MEKYIIWLHVTMHDIVFVKNLEGLKELFENEQSLWFAKFFLLGQQIFKGAPVAKLIDEVEVVGGFEHVIVSDDVRVGFDAAENVDFVDGALLQFFILSKACNWNNLDSVFFFIIRIYRSVDLSIDA